MKINKIIEIVARNHIFLVVLLRTQPLGIAHLHGVVNTRLCPCVTSVNDIILNMIYYLQLSFDLSFNVFPFFFSFCSTFSFDFRLSCRAPSDGNKSKIEEELIVRTACIKFMIYISDTRSIDGWSVNEVRSVLLHRTIIKLI